MNLIQLSQGVILNADLILEWRIENDSVSILDYHGRRGRFVGEDSKKIKEWIHPHMQAEQVAREVVVTHNKAFDVIPYADTPKQGIQSKKIKK